MFSLLSSSYASDGIYMNWEFMDWISDPEGEYLDSFLETKMFSVWDSEREVWVNSLEPMHFYSDDPALIDRLSQNPSLFTKLRMIDWDWDGTH